MFEHLKVFNVNPALQFAELRNLSRINVICGKNNSGKSTLLAAIANKPLEGRSFGLELLTMPDSRPVGLMPRNRGTQSIIPPNSLAEKTGVKDFWAKYDAFIGELLSLEYVWYENEIEKFGTVIENIAAKGRRRSIFEHVIMDFEALFRYLFRNERRVIVIPPKRDVGGSTKGRAHSELKVDANGRNLLEVLSRAKNKEKQSADLQLYNKIKDSFEEVTSGHTFNITEGDKGELLLRISYLDQDEIEADKCGLGLQDLLVILYFAIADIHDVILIEEPENHMHPEMQKRLLRFLREETTKQFFITTHSNLFLNSNYVDRVFFTEFVEGKIDVKDVTSRAEALHGLGYAVTDNLISDLIILVEGSGDKLFVEQFLSKMELDSKYRINIWILGGDEMVNQDLEVFGENHRVIGLVDRDDASSAARDLFKKRCNQLGIPVTKLARYSLESYFSIAGLSAAFNKHKKKLLPEIEGMNEAKLRSTVGNSPAWEKLSAGPQRKKNIKKMLKKYTLSVAKNMTLEEIEGTDLMNFFEQVRDKLQNN